uniref:CSON013620 protein n=2 Tax=Culicoides sonorensis TaxID=179676 RepID=A0A336M8F3_CULSO
MWLKFFIILLVLIAAINSSKNLTSNENRNLKENITILVSDHIADVIQINFNKNSTFPNKNSTKTRSALTGPTIKYNWNDPINRYSPKDFYQNTKTQKYVISESRLQEIRSHLLYPFHDTGNADGFGDLQTDLHSSTSQILKKFNFTLPFFGINYNYIRVSMNGFLEFSDPPPNYKYPLVFPIREWPKKNDPAFIGIFHSKCRIGEVTIRDIDQREPGVYYSVHSNLAKVHDRYSIELRERLLWDIRQGIIGSDTFHPKHVIIVTWKNMTFAGGLDTTLRRTNTFQAVIATDEVFTYVMFNYADINWSTHTEAGGDTVKGEGGTPAFIGFNAGNGSRSFEYKPYSQSDHIFNLANPNSGQKMPGRHIFRIDEEILPGTCNIDPEQSILHISPQSGNMLGGSIINVTGPCFNPNHEIRCIFDTIEVIGVFVDVNRAICIQPFLTVSGHINLDVFHEIDSRRLWRAKYFVETAASATEMIWFKTFDVYKKNFISLDLAWNSNNLTVNTKTFLQISLYGYQERDHNLIFIGKLGDYIPNSGSHSFKSVDFIDQITDEFLDIEVGVIKIEQMNPPKIHGIAVSSVLWSKPIPLGWYFGPQWREKYGNLWPEALCNNWIDREEKLMHFARNIPICPCTLEHAMNDKGRFLPDFGCELNGNETSCKENPDVMTCFKSGFSGSSDNPEQQCCYDQNHILMLSTDQIGGSRPKRFNDHSHVPSLSQYIHDIIPFYTCCAWQTENSDSCELFRYQMRLSQDCVGYQPPSIASVFGDPHFITLDGLEYSFNGIGEFVLLKSTDSRDKFEIQGRFEQMPRNSYGEIKASHLSSIALKGNSSNVIEIRMRSRESVRYRLDVFLDGKRIFFDKFSMKQQFYGGITVYTPLEVLNQSTVVVMMESGIGLEIKENIGLMSVQVYVPWNFINKTRGLLGNFNWNQDDDFTLPNGEVLSINPENLETIHKEFGMKWLLSDKDQEGKGKSLFLHEYGRTSDFYTNDKFQPNFIKEPRIFLPANQSNAIENATRICDESYQCRFDFGLTLNWEVAKSTKMSYDDTLKQRKINGERVISCGILDTPRYGYKSNLSFFAGTTVEFICYEGFVIKGDPSRSCTAEGKWTKEIHGYTDCIRFEEEIARTTGISLAIFLFIIVPLSLISIIILKQHFKTLREKQETLEDEKRWNEIELMRIQQQELIEAAQNEGIRNELIDKNYEINDDEKKKRLIETPL